MKQFLFKDRDGQTPLPPEYQESLIPVNLQTMGELDEHEEQNIALGLSWLEKSNGDCADHLFWRRLHKELFSRVWTWAGVIRAKELQNDDFLKVWQLGTAIKQLQDDLQFWLGSAMSPREMAARFHERMLTIHPFPNGNGRFARILTGYICKCKNFDIPTWGESYSNSKDRRRQYIDAVVAARHKQDFTKLIAFMFS